MPVRKILKIDEDLCDGCGLCVPSCAEGAIQIIDGKARLMRDDFCDGLGACLGECPNGALTLEEREAGEFDEQAVRAQHQEREAPRKPRKPIFQPVGRSGGTGCPSARVLDLRSGPPAIHAGAASEHQASALRQWPVKLRLLPPRAPFLLQADLVLAADCVPFALGSFHSEILRGRAVVIGCPKFDEYFSAKEKLTDILIQSEVRSLTVVTMEVPCCFGFWKMALEAVADAGGTIPVRQIVVSVRGEVIRTIEAEQEAAVL